MLNSSDYKTEKGQWSRKSYRSHAFPSLHTGILQGALSHPQSFDISLNSVFSPSLLSPSPFDATIQ